jgi:hypothetical protein
MEGSAKDQESCPICVNRPGAWQAQSTENPEDSGVPAQRSQGHCYGRWDGGQGRMRWDAFWGTAHDLVMLLSYISCSCAGSAMHTRLCYYLQQSEVRQVSLRLRRDFSASASVPGSRARACVMLRSGVLFWGRNSPAITTAAAVECWAW